MAMSENIGFIGLGDLGLPVAANLFDAGYPLAVYNRTASKGDALVGRGAQRATQPLDAVVTGGVVITLVWDDAAVLGIVQSAGFLERLGAGGVHVSMSTILPETAQKLAALHGRHGSQFVEAPIFGRPEAAVAKKLWIAVSGPARSKDRVRPLLDAMGAQGVFDFGEEAGAATTVKLVGNFLMISAARSVVEGLTMAGHRGMDTKAVAAMLTQTLFPIPIYQTYAKMITDNPLALEQSGIPLKDVGLFKTTAEQAASPAPLSAALFELLSVSAAGPPGR
jgi:3-hydroxyisobutyrate dehydrogenase-like beta-hydroxyacid dehydrogenase